MLTGARLEPDRAYALAGELTSQLLTLLYMESYTQHAQRPIAGATLLLLAAASMLTLWSREASPTAAPNARHTLGSDSGNSNIAGLDFSARERVGVASFYASQFFWKKMADGAPMDPHSNNAASRTLPLGTLARVTDVATGRSAIVKIEDRGPYVGGRIVDLSPSTARAIGLTPRIGIARVVVKPLSVPLPGGGTKLAAEAHGSDLRLAATMASARALP